MRERTQGKNVKKEKTRISGLSGLLPGLFVVGGYVLEGFRTFYCDTVPLVIADKLYPPNSIKNSVE